MEEKLKKYVEDIFEEVPKTKKAYELKEELVSNLLDKYKDLKSSGKTDEESYNIAISNMGNIEELTANLKEDEKDVFKNIYSEKQRKKSALLVAIAVGLYIFSIIPIILTEELENPISEGFAMILMFIMIGIATMLLVYNGMSKPKYKKIDDTMVEEFKEWKANKDTKNSSLNNIKGAMWLIIIAIYFIFSFTFMSWAYSWIIFLIGAAINNILDAIFNQKS